MIVDRNFQKLKTPLKNIPLCNMPAVRVEHDFDIILSWEEIVKTVNKTLINGEMITSLEREGYVPSHSNALNYQAKRINLPKLLPIQEALKNLFPKQHHEVDLYGCYVNSAGGFKLHKDTESTILHIQQGEAIINVVTGEMSYVFDMKQNDMIYIEKGVFHSVIGLTPRFLTSYGIFYDR